MTESRDAKSFKIECLIVMDTYLKSFKERAEKENNSYLDGYVAALQFARDRLAEVKDSQEESPKESPKESHVKDKERPAKNKKESNVRYL